MPTPDGSAQATYSIPHLHPYYSIRRGSSWIGIATRSHSALVAENLFLRKQLAFYQECETRPRRLTDAARFSLALWSRLFDWTDALVIVKPETLIRWHRRGFKLFWRWKSRAGRPRLREDIRKLIVQMVHENPTWGEERVADELALKLGVFVSPRTVRAYWPPNTNHRGPMLDLLRRLVLMPLPGPALFSQPFPTYGLIAPQPYIPGLACDPIAFAQFRHRSLMLLVLEHKPQLLFHHTARSPWHALLFTRACHRFAVSDMCPVCSVRHLPGLYPIHDTSPSGLFAKLLRLRAGSLNG